VVNKHDPPHTTETQQQQQKRQQAASEDAPKGENVDPNGKHHGSPHTDRPLDSLL
jgi:hypothetical protein